MKYSGNYCAILGLMAIAAGVSGEPASQPDIRRQGNLPLFFEANKGQVAPQVRFVSRGAGHALLLSDSDAVLKFRNTDSTGRLALRWVGGRKVTPKAEERQAGVSNYLMGSAPDKWKTNIPHYGKVRYESVYPGIDLLFYGKQSRLEYDLVVAPGADPSQIRLQFDGASNVSLQPDGDLLVRSGGSDLRQLRPVAYQETANGRRQVSAEYVLARNHVKLKLGKYDTSRPLVIDPIITWAAYIGGTNADFGEGIAVDGSGTYIAGHTISADLATVAAYDSSPNGSADAMVAKINAAGNAFVYVTYLGGSGIDRAHAIAIDSQGNAVVTGETASTNFPTANALDSDFNGGDRDGFVTKLNAAGNGLVFSTYVGGTGNDIGRGVAVDPAGSVYSAGRTDSPNFTGGTGYSGGNDAYVIKLASTGGLLYSVYQGGSGNDYGYAVAVDSAGNTYVAGETQSTNLTGQAFQPSIRGTQDGFIAKLNSTGVREFWAYLGGSAGDVINAIALDGAGNIHVAGDTSSTDFSMVRPIQPAYGGNFDAFIVKLNATGSAIVFSTYIGGALEDRGNGIVVDSNGSAVVVGYSTSTDFPRVNSLNASLQGDFDAYVVKYTPTNNARYYSTLLGGNGLERGLGVAVDTTSRVYVVGDANAAGLTPLNIPGNAFHPSLPPTNLQDAFTAQLGGCSIAITPLSAGFSAAGERRAIQVQPGPGCGNWTATPSGGFITIESGASGSGDGFVVYNVAANPGVARNGSLTIAGQQIPISQEGSVAAGCSYTVSQPTVASFGPDGGVGTLSITPAAAPCLWSAYSNARWAQVFPITGTQTTTISYTIFPNFGTQPRNVVFTAAGQARTITQAAGTGTANERFVRLLYFAFLGRLPNPTEVAFWLNELNTKTRAQVIMNFYNAPEFNLGGRFIAGLYVGLLDRDAEYGGWLFQRNALATGFGGTTQLGLVGNFLAGAEYGLRFGTPDNAEFVRLLYRHILNREASQADVNLQVGVLNGGRSRPDLANDFLNVPEFRTNSGPRLVAFLLYAALLQRDPSLAEFSARVTELSPPPSKTVDQIVGEISSSAEFNASLN